MLLLMCGTTCKASLPIKMETLRTLSVCLVFLLPLLSSAQKETCLLMSAPPRDCVCSGYSIVCTGRWPTYTELQTGDFPIRLASLTITNTTQTNLGRCETVFGTLRNLTRLDLTNNRINFTNSMSFSATCFPKLEQLILDDNSLRLTTEMHTMFKSLSLLRELHLNNALVKNQSVSAQLTHTFTASSMSSLEKVFLNDNWLGDLSSSTFNLSGAGVSSLMEIHLQNCKLGRVPDFDVAMLPQLVFIDLSMNRITGVLKPNVENFDKFSSALTVNLTGNPLTCNCELKDFAMWLNATQVTVVEPEKLVCSPQSQVETGKAIVGLDLTELTCRHITNTDIEDRMKTPYILLITVLSIIGVLAIIILFMRRKEILKFCNQMKQATKETFDTHHTSYVYSDITRATRETPEHSAVDV